MIQALFDLIGENAPALSLLIFALVVFGKGIVFGRGSAENDQDWYDTLNQ